MRLCKSMRTAWPGMHTAAHSSGTLSTQTTQSMSTLHLLRFLKRMGLNPEGAAGTSQKRCTLTYPILLASRDNTLASNEASSNSCFNGT